MVGGYAGKTLEWAGAVAAGTWAAGGIVGGVAATAAAGGALWGAEYVYSRWSQPRTRPAPDYAVSLISFNFKGKPGHMAVALEEKGEIKTCYGLYSHGVLPSTMEALKGENERSIFQG